MPDQELRRLDRVPCPLINGICPQDREKCLAWGRFTVEECCSSAGLGSVIREVEGCKFLRIGKDDK